MRNIKDRNIILSSLVLLCRIWTMRNIKPTPSIDYEDEDEEENE
jgi:hypothetical protein